MLENSIGLLIFIKKNSILYEFEKSLISNTWGFCKGVKMKRFLYIVNMIIWLNQNIGK